MFNFCPSCSSNKISFKEGKVFRCPDCSFVYYHNIAAATGCLIIVPDDANSVCGETELCSKVISGQNFRIVFLIRGKEPAAGKLDLPGGFVDIGEGVLEGLYRELQEEIGWTPVISEGKNLKDVFSLFASFANVYKYKNIDYNTCDIYFSVITPNLKPEDLHLEKAEIAGVRFLKPNEIDFSEFAFPSTIKAVKTFLSES